MGAQVFLDFILVNVGSLVSPLRLVECNTLVAEKQFVPYVQSRSLSQNFFIYLALLFKEKGRRHAKLALTTPLLFPPQRSKKKLLAIKSGHFLQRLLGSGSICVLPWTQDTQYLTTSEVVLYDENFKKNASKLCDIFFGEKKPQIQLFLLSFRATSILPQKKIYIYLGFLNFKISQILKAFQLFYFSTSPEIARSV